MKLLLIQIFIANVLSITFEQESLIELTPLMILVERLSFKLARIALINNIIFNKHKYTEYSVVEYNVIIDSKP